MAKKNMKTGVDMSGYGRFESGVKSCKITRNLEIKSCQTESEHVDVTDKPGKPVHHATRSFSSKLTLSLDENLNMGRQSSVKSMQKCLELLAIQLSDSYRAPVAEPKQLPSIVASEKSESDKSEQLEASTKLRALVNFSIRAKRLLKDDKVLSRQGSSRGLISRNGTPKSLRKQESNALLGKEGSSRKRLMRTESQSSSNLSQSSLRQQSLVKITPEETMHRKLMKKQISSTVLPKINKDV